MKTKFVAATLFAAFMLPWSAMPAMAQAENGIVVATCGTSTYIVGTTRPITLDATGRICFVTGGGGGAVAATPAAFTGLYAITTGGTPQQLAAANEVSNDCVIQNPTTATQQNIGAAESLFVNFVTAATLLSGGTTIELAPGVAIGCGGKNTTAISVNAATSAHRFSGYRR